MGDLGEGGRLAPRRTPNEGPANSSGKVDTKGRAKPAIGGYEGLNPRCTPYEGPASSGSEVDTKARSKRAIGDLGG
jgi:hypothetical protein